MKTFPDTVSNFRAMKPFVIFIICILAIILVKNGLKCKDNNYYSIINEDVKAEIITNCSFNSTMDRINCLSNDQCWAADNFILNQFEQIVRNCQKMYLDVAGFLIKTKLSHKINVSNSEQIRITVSIDFISSHLRSVVNSISNQIKQENCLENASNVTRCSDNNLTSLIESMTRFIYCLNKIGLNVRFLDKMNEYMTSIRNCLKIAFYADRCLIKMNELMTINVSNSEQIRITVSIDFISSHLRSVVNSILNQFEQENYLKLFLNFIRCIYDIFNNLIKIMTVVRYCLNKICFNVRFLDVMIEFIETNITNYLKIALDYVEIILWMLGQN